MLIQEVLKKSWDLFTKNWMLFISMFSVIFLITLITVSPYLIRNYDDRPHEGVIIVRGTSSTNTIVSILDQIGSKYNVKIVSAISWELFQRQDQSYKNSIISGSLKSLIRSY